MQFENLYQDLIHGAEIVRALTADISQEEARLKPDPESWSVLEVLCHLYDIEREDFRKRLDSILHRPSEAWELFDVGEWVTTHSYNERDLAETLAGFLAERQKSLDWLKSLPAPDWQAAHTSSYGTMTAGEMFSAWVAHDNLHIRQLVELRHVRIVRQAQPYDTGYAGEW